MEYSEYISSNKWKIKRIQAMNHYGKKCAICERKNDLHVHHIDYSNLGDEHFKDLRILCSEHHMELHQLHEKSLMSLRDFSIFYIKNSKKTKNKAKKFKTKEKHNINQVVKLENLNSPEAVMIYDAAIKALALPKSKERNAFIQECNKRLQDLKKDLSGLTMG